MSKVFAGLKKALEQEGKTVDDIDKWLQQLCHEMQDDSEEAFQERINKERWVKVSDVEKRVDEAEAEWKRKLQKLRDEFRSEKLKEKTWEHWVREWYVFERLADFIEKELLEEASEK